MTRIVIITRVVKPVKVGTLTGSSRGALAVSSRDSESLSRAYYRDCASDHWQYSSPGPPSRSRTLADSGSDVFNTGRQHTLLRLRLSSALPDSDKPEFRPLASKT